MTPGQPLETPPDALPACALIVDDDPVLRTQLQRLVGKLVTDVKLAGDGLQAMEIWRQSRPDVILTDLMMPVMDGLTMIQAIKTEDPDAQIIVITASASDRDLRRALELGVERYILKPVEQHLLHDAIRKCIRDRQGREELRLSQLVSRLTNELMQQLSEKQRYVNGHGELECSAEGRPVRMFGTVHDITARKLVEEALQHEKAEQATLIRELEEAQTQLLQSEKLASIGQLAAGVAHEINNPIGFVHSNLGTLGGNLESLFTLIEACEDILTEVPPDNLKRIRLEALKQLSQLNQVFMNLLVNAAHAIEGPRGTITLRTGRNGNNEVWVEVADTGKGIPEEVRNRIFDPFFTTKPVGKGTGLGLSLSYGIVKKHHGRFELESQVGKGSTFRVVLPIQTQDPAPESSP